MSTFQENFKGKVRTVNATYMWELTNFCLSCKEFGSQHWSPVFHCNNSKWQIQLFPRGDREESKDYVSVYLWLRGGDSVNATYELSILNDKNQKNVLHREKQNFVTKKGQGTNKFIKQNDLTMKKNAFLVNDTLRILCKIIVDETNYVVQETDEGPPRKRARLHGNCNFQKFYNSEQFSDVKFITNDGKCIYAHKTILANSSDVFMSMFINRSENNEETKTIELNDVDYEVLEEMFRFIYTKEVHELQKYARKLLVLAIKYNINCLKLVCEANLCKNLSVDNVVDGLVTARSYNLALLEKKAIDFMAEHMNDLVDEPAFKSVTSLHSDVIVEIFRRTAEQNK